MSNSDNIYVGLDIGTTSIKVIIAEYVKNQLNILGYGNVRSQGVHRGIIVDIEQAVTAIKEAVTQAEQKANIEIREVIVGIPANLLQIERCQGMIAVANEDGSSKTITREDVVALTNTALVQNLPAERAIIDVIPEWFVVDGLTDMKDPRGMVGVRMEMEAITYTGPKTILHNIKTCVERAGLIVRDTVVAPLAAAQLALNDAEQDFGTILIDLGGGQTTASVMHDHKLKYAYVDQEGGDYVTRDISVVLNTSIAKAEVLKQQYGYAHAGMASEDVVISVDVVGQQEPEKISEKYLAEIIEARMVQIFEKLRTALENVKALDLPGGIVLTGGMAALPGVEELAREIFGVNVKTYIPQEMNLRFPSFTQVIGLVDYETTQSEIERIVAHTADGNLTVTDFPVVTAQPQPAVQEKEVEQVEEVIEAPVQHEPVAKPKKTKKPALKKKKQGLLRHLISELFEEKN